MVGGAPLDQGALVEEVARHLDPDAGLRELAAARLDVVGVVALVDPPRPVGEVARGDVEADHGLVELAVHGLDDALEALAWGREAEGADDGHARRRLGQRARPGLQRPREGVGEPVLGERRVEAEIGVEDVRRDHGEGVARRDLEHHREDPARHLPDHLEPELAHGGRMVVDDPEVDLRLEDEGPQVAELHVVQLVGRRALERPMDHEARLVDAARLAVRVDEDATDRPGHFNLPGIRAGGWPSAGPRRRPWRRPWDRP
jgi:hypothetical protein